MSEFQTIGFIGLGVMGEPMCRNLATSLDAKIIGFDKQSEPLQRLAGVGVDTAGSVAEIARTADLVLLSLPGSPEVERVCLGDGGIADTAASGLVVADLSTCAVSTARKVGDALAEKRIAFADAPVMRTAKAAVEGTLSICVGGDPALFQRLKPVLATMGSKVNHAGAIGAGQVIKLLNNMVLTQTLVALAEALTMAQRADVDPHVLFDILSKGSGDSFALRNHGMKSMLPKTFPRQAYSTRYALKDIGYALELAAETGVNARGAELAQTLLSETEALGFGDDYYPALLHAIDDTLDKA